MSLFCVFFFFFSSRRRHTRFDCDWSSDVCSSDLLEMRMVSDDAAGVDAGASGKVQELPVVPQVQRLGNSSSEINSATIHRGGELIGERPVLHRLRPFLFALETAPVRPLVRAQNVEKISEHR